MDMSRAHITLDVCGRKFITTVGSLTKRSEYFAAFIFSLWVLPSYIFIDADPAVFEHVLKYLRRGVFPLAFNCGSVSSSTGKKTSGHDYGLVCIYMKMFIVGRGPVFLDSEAANVGPR